MIQLQIYYDYENIVIQIQNQFIKNNIEYNECFTELKSKVTIFFYYYHLPYLRTHSQHLYCYLKELHTNI